MRIFIQASELLMSKEEMLQRIPQNKLEQIKGKGILQAYTLAQEGLSKPREIQKNHTTPLILKWTKSIIHRLSQKIKEGTKFFIDHGKGTNEHSGRQSVGEILTSFVKDIGGKLSNIIIGHFPNSSDVKDLDICSMEADINTVEDYVDDVNEVSGIALGNSNIEHPAFPGAIRLNAIQCFEKQNTGNNISGEGVNNMADEKKSLTFGEVKQAVKDMNIFPWQLYSLEDIKSDKVFGKIIDENSTFKSENERLTKENQDLKSTSSDAIRKSKVLDAGKQLEELMKEGFTEKQKTFIIKRFNPDNMEDLSEEALKTFIKKGEEEYAKQAKFFGANEDTSSKEKTGEDSKSKDLSVEDEALQIIGA